MKVLNVVTNAAFCGIGAVGMYLALVNDATVCRAVVLHDIQAHEQYAQKLAAAMPSQQQDFLTALTKNR